MGVKDLLGKVKDTVESITPGSVKDALLGDRQAPPTPTTDQQARDLIDASIGRQPGDTEIVNRLKSYQITAKLISAVDTASEGLFTGGPYSPDIRARWATGQIQEPPDPYTIADKDLKDYFQSTPRANLLYARNFDPQNKELMPYLIESQTTRHGGLLSTFKTAVSDLAGRPIGGALELLAKPAKWAEIQYGTHFVWNDVGDASLRRAMSKYTYEARLNVNDWNGSWERKARLQAETIENSGLRGDQAAAEFEKWVHGAGNPGLSAAITDFAAQVAFDPLWLVPGESILEGAGKGLRLGTKLEEGTSLSRLFRIGSAGAARSTFGFDSVREMLKADELTYRTAQITTPGLRGSQLWLFEKTPQRLGDAIARETSLILSGPLARSATLDDQINVLAHFNEVMRTGKVEGEAATLFGKDLFSKPVLAQAQARLGQLKGRQAVENVLEGLTKHADLAAAPAVERARLLSLHVESTMRSAMVDAQNAIYPQWFTKRYLPIVAWQKATMGIFTLSRPGFIALNMGNNLFTYMWQGLLHPTAIGDMARDFGRALHAETVSKEVPEVWKKLATSQGLDFNDIERTISGNVTREEIFGQSKSRGFNLNDDDLDVKRALAASRQAVTKPLKDLTPFKFSSAFTWPVLAASRLDRATRRATFYNALKEQVNLGTSPARVIEGLIPELRNQLVGAGLDQRTAERWEGHMISSVRSFIYGGGSMADPAAMRTMWLKASQELIDSKPVAHVSAYDYAFRFARERLGMTDEAAVHYIRDLDPTITKIHDEVFQKFTDQPDVKLAINQLDNIGDALWTVDRVAANATKTAPVLRPATGYSRGLSLTEDGIREDLLDSVKHIDRLASTVLPNWSGNAFARRKILGAADDMIQGRLQRLADIRRAKMESLAAGASKSPEWAKRESELWTEYHDFTRDSQRGLFDAVHDELSGIDEHTQKVVEDWYATLIKTQDEHKKIVQAAREIDTPDAWEKAGEKVKNVYEQGALRRADIFSWAPNEAEVNMGHLRPTAPLVRQNEEFIKFVADNLGVDLAAAIHGGEGVTGTKTAHDILRSAANDMADRAPDIARQHIANARAKTDFVMLDYDNQIGLDSALQMFAPYEFFPTRTAYNWAIRVARNPGTGAALVKAILNPADYSARYGQPDRLKYRIPIPIPFLQDWLQHMPVIGDKISNADFGNIYWVDPLAYMFPMTNFRNDFNDEAKTGVGLGGVANYFEQNTPLGISPYAKIIGGFSGLLDRDAWTNSMFQGGPFGIPMTAYGAAAGKWLYTGDGSDVPDSEKDIFSSAGHFTKEFLGNIVGLNGNRFDDYRRERALASLVAEGKIEPDAAWEAMATHKGDAWNKAVKAAESEKFLSDFTGWLGFRITGSMKGEQIRLGEKALYSKAAAEGNLTDFYTKFPDYEIYNVAVKGIKDPKERQQALETNLYYRDLETYVNGPYQKSLDDLETRINAIRAKDTLTETDIDQIKYLNDNVASIKDEQSSVRDMVDRAYPNRTKELSLLMPPKERALTDAVAGWYDMQQGQGAGVPADESYEDFQARRESWLRSFPAKGADQSEYDWETLFGAYQTTVSRYNLMINKAYGNGEFDEGQRLTEERDAVLASVHEKATERITRYDVEHWLAQFSRRATPSEVEFNTAADQFQLWMSLVGANSPLTNRQKGAISAYFRSLPLLQKHYNASVLNINLLSGDQLIAFARRKEIRDHYNNLGTDDAKIDYMRSVAAEYNSIQAMLGLPPVDIVDARPSPPGVSHSDSIGALQGFNGGGRDQLDFLAGGPNDIQSDQPMAMDLKDIQRYVDATTSRGY